MNIAYLFGTYPQLSETFLQREVDALQNGGIEVEIWAGQARSPARQMPIPRAWWKKYVYRTGYYNEAGQLLAAQLRDVDHIHATWSSFPAEVAMAAARELNVSWSFSGHAHDLWVAPHQLPQKLESAAFATACTRQGVAFLQSQHPPCASKVLFAPHGLPLTEYPFTTRQHFYPPLRVLAVGRLVEKKGFDILLHALRILQDHGACPETTLLGDGPQRRGLEKLASELKLTHLYFEGAVPPTKVRAHMQRASILVAPCVIGKDGDHDGLPNVLIEAAALGLPILTTPIGGIGDLITDQTGWLCAPGDAADLAQKLNHVFENPEMAFRKSHTARLAVEAHYDAAKNIEILTSAFRRLGKSTFC